MKQNEPEVSRMGFLDMQVCVPSSWDDKSVKDYADKNNLCGTVNGWAIRKESSNLFGSPERVKCHDKEDFVHIMLDA